jgi:outer membrane lipopolysaccharide assembly protein LptE/RlpB|tara:strand:+ start:23 stop:535 length:513 start_codon:yes stop_codon:yes gene_type:complete
MITLRFLFITLAAILTAGCGYHLVGYGSSLPNHIKTIAIPTFKNSSIEPNIHRDVTDSIRRAFISDGRLKLIDARRADLIIKGTLIKYQLQPVSFSAQDTVDEYIIRLGVQIEAYDRIKKKLLFKQEFNPQWDYRVTSSVVDSESARNTALIRSYNDLADQLVSIIIDQF